MEQINTNITSNIAGNNSSNNQNYTDYIETNKKIIGNAISSYLMIFFGWLLLFNKTNPNINNDFVKGHTKSATMIHLGFFITYFIFISNSLFAGTIIFGIGLNNIIANVIFLGLLSMIILGVYKAKNGLEFKISKTITITKKTNILDLDGDGDISEREKMTILLSFIPFIGYHNYPNYSENKTIQDSNKLNITITLFICLLYISDYSNLANLLTLFYTILVTFIGINLFTRNELLQIKLPEIFSPNKLHLLLKITFKYTINYFNDNKFKEFSVLEKEISENEKILQEKDLEYLNTKKDLRPAKFLIYVPFINLIYIFFKNTKYNYHIKNGLIITLITSTIIILSYYIYISNYVYILLLMPISFGIGYTKNKLEYKMPYVYDLYILIANIFGLLKFGSKKVSEKRKEINEISLKVGED
ncbi:MAG: hypothetical protein PHS49_03770 [Candidatus Gracilibacteria bacterium]|nr:hypothetical protein [Candidatus Gracilibacteria bacterium]